MRLQGKTAVVTGSATGIGQGIALALAQQGANVVVTYHHTPPRETLALLEGVGANATPVQLDSSDRASIRALMAAAAGAYGGIDILVNDAAIQLNHWLLEYTVEEYERMMRVNLMGYWRCIQEAFPYLRQSSSGRVLNVASVHAKRPTGFDAVYGMTKGGVKMLTREAAVALSPYHITVNALNYGAIRVPTRSGNPEFKAPRKLPSALPDGCEYLSGRVGKPVDASGIAAFLAGPESWYITGAAIRVDGGAMLVSP